MPVFIDAFYEHFGHTGFRWDDNPRCLEVGFVCTDCETETYRIRMAELAVIRMNHPQFVTDFENWRGIWLVQQKKKANRAEKRALRILERHLTRQQRREFRHLQEFHVAGADGRTYRIERAAHTNVIVEREGQDIARYCAVISYEYFVPIYDLMLAQKLILETAPELFYRVANVIPINRDTNIPIYDAETGTIVETRFEEPLWIDTTNTRLGVPRINLRDIQRFHLEDEQEAIEVAQAHNEGWLRDRGFRLRHIEDNEGHVLVLERIEDNERRDRDAEDGAPGGGQLRINPVPEGRHEAHLEQEQRGRGVECEEDVRRSA